MAGFPAKVFISYTHDSQKHKDQVLALSDRLRAEGVECRIDQYEESPPEGWPRWMVKQVQSADFVLIVCTATYERRFNDEEESGKGKGAKWEGAVITQSLYDAEGRNRKFIPVLFSAADTRHVPHILRGATYYVVDTDEGYRELYRRMTGQPRVQMPPLVKLVRMPKAGPQQISQHPRRVAPALQPPAAGKGKRSNQRVRGKPRQPMPGGPRPSEGRAGAGLRREPHTDLVLLMTDDSQFVVTRYERIETQEVTRFYLLAEDAKVAAFLSRLRQAHHARLSAAFGLQVLRGRLQPLRVTRQGPKEVWELPVVEEPLQHSAFHEIAYGNFSGDDIAKMRARHVLLGEALPNDRFFGLSTWPAQGTPKPDALWAELLTRFSTTPAKLLAVAKLAFILQLRLAGIIEHVHSLDLRQKRGAISVQFEGVRPQVYSNREPTIIRVAGERPAAA